MFYLYLLFMCIYLNIYTYIYICFVVYIYTYIYLFMYRYIHIYTYWDLSSFHIHTYLDVYIYIEYDFIHTVHPNSWLIHFGTSPWIGLHRARRRYNCAAQNAFPHRKMQGSEFKGKSIPTDTTYLYIYISIYGLVKNGCFGGNMGYYFGNNF